MLRENIVRAIGERGAAFRSLHDTWADIDQSTISRLATRSAA